jgi:DNA-binding Lrp family transcriptional regulator
MGVLLRRSVGRWDAVPSRPRQPASSSLVDLSNDQTERLTDCTVVIDALDARLIEAMARSPRAGVLELSRQLRVARGTVQARLDKLQARGVVTGFGPDVDLVALGYTVLAFTTIEIAQGRLADVIGHLEQIPEVIEAHTTTGQGDLHVRVVGRTNQHLSHVLNQVLEAPGISRTTTVLALAPQIAYRVLPLVAAAAADAESPAEPMTGEPGPVR